MITDKEHIKEAIDYVFSQEMYIPVTRDTFEDVCPNPALVIHVTGRSPAEAVKLFQIDIAIASQRQFSSVVLYIKSLSLTMMDLERIDLSMPPSKQYKRCLSFARPEEGDVEIVLFAETVQEKEEFQV